MRRLGWAFTSAALVAVGIGIYSARASDPPPHKFLLVSIAMSDAAVSHSVVLMESEAECNAAAAAMVELAATINMSGGVMCKEVIPGRRLHSKSPKPESSS